MLGTREMVTNYIFQIHESVFREHARTTRAAEEGGGREFRWFRWCAMRHTKYLANDFSAESCQTLCARFAEPLFPICSQLVVGFYLPNIYILFRMALPRSSTTAASFHAQRNMNFLLLICGRFRRNVSHSWLRPENFGCSL